MAIALDLVDEYTRTGVLNREEVETAVGVMRTAAKAFLIYAALFALLALFVHPLFLGGIVVVAGLFGYEVLTIEGRIARLVNDNLLFQHIQNSKNPSTALIEYLEEGMYLSRIFQVLSNLFL